MLCWIFSAFLALCQWHLLQAYVEIVEERASMEKEFRLTCRHLDSHIAVLDAIFTPTRANIQKPNFIESLIPEEERYPVRLALNQRCSGVNHCSFILHADCPISKFWGPGEVYIKYACMADRRVTPYCNVELLIPEGGGEKAQGFITTPGYPKFYLGHSECHWTIRAPHDQKVQLTLLDVSLSKLVSSSEDNSSENCEDELRVVDEENLVLSTCSGAEVAPVVTSATNLLEIHVTGRSGSLVPKRGVLMYYTSVGCPTLDAPMDGYLVYRNETNAEYMCCVGYVFPDTLEKHKVLTCSLNMWDHQLPEYCIDKTELIFNNNSIPSEIKDTRNPSNMSSEMSNVIDVVIPSLLIAGLLCGNAIVIYIIHRYRKRKNMDIQEEEELSNIVLT